MHDCFEHCGSFDNSEYEETELNKGEEHARLFKDESGGVGIFLLNYYLYNMCARNWKVPLRYRIKDMVGYNVVLEEDPAYEPIKVALRRSKELLDKLSKIVRLPPAIESYRQRLDETQRAVDKMRVEKEPEALVKYPVQGSLYEHQVRAANMALMTFGFIETTKKEDTINGKD